MTRKLTEMDNVISDLTESIDEDTVLFVMGDHGMTLSGDHGGDSMDEVMAGLFAYSKIRLFTPSNDTKELPQVSQIDLVPTLSLLIDLPIPFSNLGSIIPDFFDGHHHNFLPDFLQRAFLHASTYVETDDLVELVAKLFKSINKAYSAYLNCKQTLTYINEYQQLSADLPIHKIEAIKGSFEFLDEKFHEFLENLVLVDWTNREMVAAKSKDIEEATLDFLYLHESFQDILQHIKVICRSVWAKFDLVSMSMGLSLMLFIAVVILFCPTVMESSTITESGTLSNFICLAGFGFSIVGIVYLAIPFYDVQMSSFVVFAAVSFSFSLWLFSCGVFAKSAKYYSVHSFCSVSKMLFNDPSRFFAGRILFMTTCFSVYLMSLFSNSYVIHEDTTTLFLCQSYVVVCYVCHTVAMLREHKTAEQNKAAKAKSFTILRTRIKRQFLEWKNLKMNLVTVVLMVCMRWTKYFWFCREMQLKCNISPYSLQLVSLLSEFTEGRAHERLFLALLSLIAIAALTYFYLKKRGNLNGTTSYVYVVKYAGIVCVVLISLHWNLQLVLHHKISALFDILNLQQILLPRVVYAIFLASITCLISKPLCIKTILRDTSQPSSSVDRHNDDLTIPEIYKELKDQLSTVCSKHMEPKPPIVYGLKTVYSSAFIALLYILLLVTSLVLSDGMAVPVLLLWIAAFCVCRLFSLNTSIEICSYSKIYISMLTWNFFASFGFFGTGHQTTLPAIRFHAAYIGFRGSLPEMVAQVIVILLNTFASQIICGLALPLLLVFNNMASCTVSRSGKSDEDNEVKLLEQRETSRINLFRMMVVYLAIMMVKVSITAASAALHRRHLMVWKIFAPRFLFEAISFLICSPIILMGYGFYTRIDNSLRRWMTMLEELLHLQKKTLH